MGGVRTVLVLVGPTAVGKTAVATALAALEPIEIVSADSRQLYRSLDIGTAKPGAAERGAAPYHLLDVVLPTERYSAGRFAREAAQCIRGIQGRGRLPVVVGGTGFYVRALFQGLFAEPPLDPARRAALREVLAPLPAATVRHWATRLDPGFAGGGRQRAARAIEIALFTGRPLSVLRGAAPSAAPSLPAWYARLALPRDALTERIRARAQAMLDAGLVDEVRRVLAAGVPRDAPGLSAVGYPDVLEHLEGRLPAAHLAETIAAATRRYAKRQDTWFRHQLKGPTATFDALQPAKTLAQAVLAGYRAATAAPT